VVPAKFNGSNAKQVFSSSETPIVYLGVDFTLAKLIDATEPALDVRDKSYPAINDLIVSEQKKYDLAAAFHKTSMDNDLSMVTKRNAKINAEEIKSNNQGDYNRLKEDDITSL
jgi:hypothetical protein